MPEKEARGATLYERINRVKRDIERVRKTGKNQHFGYAFATESDIADALRPLMAEHGVCLVYHGPEPSMLVVTPGDKQAMHTVWVKYEVVNADNPQEREEIWGIGEALDGQDKGITKALTAAAKYVWLKLFDISTGDTEAEPDHGGGREVFQPERVVAKAPPKPKLPKVEAPKAEPIPEEPQGFGPQRAECVAIGLKRKEKTLKDLRTNLMKINPDAVLPENVEDWPIEAWPVVVKKLEIRDIFVPLAAESQEYALLDEIEKEVEKRWESGVKSHKFKPGEPRTPKSFVTMHTAEAMLHPHEDQRCLALKAILAKHKRGDVMYPDGLEIQF